MRDSDRGGWLNRRFGRRRLLKTGLGFGGAVLLAACRDDDSTPTIPVTPSPTPLVPAVDGYTNPQKWLGRSIVVTSPGGEYQEAQQAAIFEPFERLTGATIEVDLTDLDALNLQVETAEVRWSACDVPTEDVSSLANAGVLADLDFAVINQSGLFPAALMPYGVPSAVYATILAYRADAWPELPPPASWADVWDVGRYEGLRGFRSDPMTTLEFALLADGVFPRALYPLDVDRALAKLDKIREWIGLWWQQGAQPAQMIASGDLALVAAWHNRIERLAEEGSPLGVEWSGAALGSQSWIVPAGAPEIDVAMDFVNFATRPEVCAAFSSIFPFAPANEAAYGLLPPSLLGILPGPYGQRDDQFSIDYEWWFTNRSAVQTRFQEWLQVEA